jgi:hypothetical protein
MISKSRKHKLIKAALYERLLLLGAIGVALAAVYLGYVIARKKGDPHWINRTGAAIVATEGVIAVAEFLRQERLKRIRSGIMVGGGVGRTSGTGSEALTLSRANNILEREIRRSELQIVIIAAFLAIIGEVLHGFGDIIYEALIGVIRH